MSTEFNFDPERESISASFSNDEAAWMLLDLYMDGEANPEEAARAEALLRSDPAYARGYSFLQMTGQAVRSFAEAEIEPPAGLRESIFAATTQRRSLRDRLVFAWADFRQRQAFPSRYKLALGGMAVATLVAAVAWPYHNNGARTTAPDIAASKQSPPLLPSPKQPEVGEPRLALGNGSLEAVMPPAIRINPHPNIPGKHIIIVHDLVAPPRTLKELVRVQSSKKTISARLSPAALAAAQAVANAARSSAEAETYPSTNSDSEAKNRQMLEVAMNNSGGSLGSDVQTDDPTLTEPTDNPNVAAANAPKKDTPKVMVAYLPPGEDQVLTSMDMKRHLKAQTMGYDREVVRSIKEKQIYAPLIKTHF